MKSVVVTPARVKATLSLPEAITAVPAVENVECAQA
jgi:hypothetical protein